MVVEKLFSGVYKNKKVLVTGHTGFKGSWMCYWLLEMGADVCGYSTRAPSNPAHMDILNLPMQSIIGDIRDQSHLNQTFQNFQPEIVFHMAAQPLVRLSYEKPDETFEVNVMGTLRVYEACRKINSVKSIVSITTDKVYENNEWDWGYREIDELGGKDPYSSSKAAMEIMTNSYRHSYFNLDKFEKNHDVLLATARAGNVIGGGDWALDRLIPDIVKASLDEKPVSIRSPHSTRPWQHVLDPLSGYLLLGQKLIERKPGFAEAFNFGPLMSEDLSVEQVLKTLKLYWNKIEYNIIEPTIVHHEAGLLKLDCSKSHRKLIWKPVWDTATSLEKTITWYKKYYESGNHNTKKDLYDYLSMAKEKGLVWS